VLFRFERNDTVHILLTGEIQVGKSTVISRFIEKHSLEVGGFKTFWRQENDGRTLYLSPYAGGPCAAAARGERGGILSFPGSFDACCGFLKTDKPIIIMDELGVLERDAALWQEAVLSAFDSGAAVLGVIKPKKCEFLDKIRARDDVTVVEVNEHNREDVLAWLDTVFEAGKTPVYAPAKVYSFVAWSGTGKTTLLEKLIPLLVSRGLRVGVMKHDAHEFQVDKPGKDSYRLSQAGAAVTVISSQTHAAVMENRPLAMQQLLDHMKDVDIILTEGYKHGPWKKIGLERAATGKRVPPIDGEYFAVMSDYEDRAEGALSLDDAEGIAKLITEDLEK